MITRFVPSCPGLSGSGATDVDDAGSNQLGRATRASAPEEILRQAHATSLVGILSQIAAVAEHSFQIFSELKDESACLNERFQRVQTRVSMIADIATAASADSQAEHEIFLIKKLPTREESDAVLAIPETSFSRTTRHLAIAEAYAKCEPMPALEVFDAFCKDPPSAESEMNLLSRKKYSDPSFFVNEWMKKESLRHQQALQAKEEKRRERRELKRGQSLSQQKQPRGDSSESSNNLNNATGSEHEPRKILPRTASGGSNKFLKIRSWREIYGTGEGKELARQQQQAASSSVSVSGGIGKLDGKKEPPRKSLTAAINGESHDSDSVPTAVAVAELPVPALQSARYSQEAVQSVVDQQQQLSYDPLGDYEAHDHYPPPSPPPPPPVPSTVCSGAFMQEIDDDDEIFYELAGGDDAFVLDGGCGSGNNKNAIESEEFVDHGLSYYHDPAFAPPPPPPSPPTLDEPECSEDNYRAMMCDIEMDAYSPESDDFVPPPPPSSPPFEVEAVDSQVDITATPVLLRPPFCLLREIQLGASLRHITIDEDQEDQDDDQAAPENELNVNWLPSAATTSHLTLLEQIKMKQRSLRPVEQQPPRQKFVSNLAAPFADSIARILERRSMIAYDSDSSSEGQAEDSKASENDW